MTGTVRELFACLVLFAFGGLLAVLFMATAALQADVDALKRDPLRHWAMACVSSAQSNEDVELHKRQVNKSTLTHRGE